MDQEVALLLLMSTEFETLCSTLLMGSSLCMELGDRLPLGQVYITEVNNLSFTSRQITLGAQGPGPLLNNWLCHIMQAISLFQIFFFL